MCYKFDKKKIKVYLKKVFNLSFPNNTILFFLIFFFFIIDYTNLITQIFIRTVELIIPPGTQINEPDAEIETQPVIAEDRIRKCST